MTDSDHELKTGNILAKRLRSAIKHEQTKLRRQMLQNPQTRPLSALRIYKDVNAIVEHTLHAIDIARHSPRPKTRIEILQHLLTDLDANIFEPNSVPQWVYPYLLIEDEDAESDIFDNPSELEMRIISAIQMIEASAERIQARKGGRVSDPNFFALLHKLALLYQEYTGFRATYSESKDGTGQQSPFFFFAQDVLRHFFTKGPEAEWAVREGMVQTSIRHISRFERKDTPEPNDPEGPNSLWINKLLDTPDM